DKPREWTPLVYCWRGGQRSRALAHVLSQIGWRAHQLDGGYRAYRRQVVATLATVPARFDYRVICGLTGAGKSRLLYALAAEGAQTLDLEGLARHRGSLLGDLPGDPQPSQKAFESRLADALASLDSARPVFVESESRKIGDLQLPDALLAAMRASRCVRLDTPTPLRVAMLKAEYAHFLAAPDELTARLAHLAPVYGKSVLARWKTLATRKEFDALVVELLEQHYDPMYARSMARNFSRAGDALVARADADSPAAFRGVARDVIERSAAHAPAIA
ncbi:MAG: tRNA 2-selenouridine(34) synthase MnmH, partial [Betaproteobacteria bacterium]